MKQNFRHFEPASTDPKKANRSRIEELIELGRGLNFEAPPREVGTVKETDFY